MAKKAARAQCVIITVTERWMDGGIAISKFTIHASFFLLGTECCRCVKCNKSVVADNRTIYLMAAQYINGFAGMYEDTLLMVQRSVVGVAMA
jgi:hypothetical protein